ncbi:hypothetical protein ACOTCH_30810 [Achromobacter xylosoxidans]
MLDRGNSSRPRTLRLEERRAYRYDARGYSKKPPDRRILMHCGREAFGSLLDAGIVADVDASAAKLAGQFLDLCFFRCGEIHAGGVWAIVGRVVHYRNLSLSAASISKALLLENLGFGVTALALGTPVAVAMALKAGWLSGMGWSAVAMVVIAMIWAGSRLLVRRGVAISRLNAGIGSVALMVMTLGWVAMGTSFFLLLATFGSWLDWLWIVGTYAVAFTTGMVAIFAPAGAGVREGVLTLAGQMHGVSAAMMLDAALLNRALWVVADVCFFCFALALRATKK